MQLAPNFLYWRVAKDQVSPREIVLGNIEHSGPARSGLAFSGGRVNDIVGVGFKPHGYIQKRWTENRVEYYDDEWGNIWVRMIGGSNKGEVHKPIIEAWDQLDEFVPPDYGHADVGIDIRKRSEKKRR